MHYILKYHFPFTFISRIPLKIIFAFDVRHWSIFRFFPINYDFTKHHFLEGLSFPPALQYYLCYSVYMYMLISFSLLNSVLLLYFPIVQYHTIFITGAFSYQKGLYFNFELYTPESFHIPHTELS